jgi:dipeptidyl aminopeptidase/acylaminoacyl peptidase
MSPNGRYVTALVAMPGVRKSLAVFDLATMTPKILARYSNGDVGKAFWLNDKRIAFTVVNIDPSFRDGTAGLYGIDLDGQDARGLAPALVNQRSFAEAEDLPGPDMAPDVLQGSSPKLSDNMFVIVDIDGDKHLGTLNTRNSKQKEVAAPRGSFSWLLDHSNALRVAVTDDGPLHALHFLSDGGWRKVTTFAPSSDTTLVPRVYVGKTLYVQGQNGADRISLFRYNLERGAIDGTSLIASPDFDIEGVPVVAADRLLGFRVNTDAESTVWFDPEMKALQAEVDARLPATVNRITLGNRSETPFALVEAYSPVAPGDTLVYNREAKTMVRLGQALPGIEPAQMAASSDFMRYKARDGLSIPAYLTLPPGAPPKNLPTVILAGAYPWKRNAAWAFDPVVQFLASRGYAVIQPETRGARGFGAAHFKAGLRQWGLAMQDDLADSAKWAIAEGIADPKRICIAGTVYGGYAAMMGLIKDPELFKCGISWAGIVDIKLMFKHRWQEFPESGYGDKFKVLVGDPDKDQAQFNATSPLLNAARIKAPVLLAYGDKDVEVPGKHGLLLYEAIKPGNPAAEFMLFDQKAQPHSLEKNRVELWTRIEQFLERQIGKP